MIFKVHVTAHDFLSFKLLFGAQILSAVFFVLQDKVKKVHQFEPTVGQVLCSSKQHF